MRWTGIMLKEQNPVVGRGNVEPLVSSAGLLGMP